MNPLDLIPPQYKVLAIAIACAIALVGTFTAGCQVTAWRKNAEIADLKREHAEQQAKDSQKSLDDFVSVSATIIKAANGANIDISGLNKQLAAIRKEFHDANAKPLPPDCAPDDVRMRSLTKSVEAVRKAATGQ
jgi:hypothetical protein